MAFIQKEYSRSTLFWNRLEVVEPKFLDSVESQVISSFFFLPSSCFFSVSLIKIVVLANDLMNFKIWLGLRTVFLFDSEPHFGEFE